MTHATQDVICTDAAATEEEEDCVSLLVDGAGCCDMSGTSPGGGSSRTRFRCLNMGSSANASASSF